MYVCLCKGITDSQIRTAVADGMTNYHDVRRALGLSSQCGKCSLFAREIFSDAVAAVDSSLFYNADTQAA
jgi:bacterioferritin-associated ferredoxin